jgi:hypothetical protein
MRVSRFAPQRLSCIGVTVAQFKALELSEQETPRKHTAILISFVAPQKGINAVASHSALCSWVSLKQGDSWGFNHASLPL